MDCPRFPHSSLLAAVLSFCSGGQASERSVGPDPVEGVGEGFDAAVHLHDVLIFDLPAAVEFATPCPVGALDASVEFGRFRRQDPEIDAPSFALSIEFGLELASAVDLDRLHLEWHLLDDFAEEFTAVLHGRALEVLVQTHFATGRRR